MRNTSKIKDLTGMKFNKLTVIGIASRNPLYWECKCDCGNTTKVRTANLKRNMVKSCGCLQHRGNPVHNLSKTRIYRIYKKMIRRCYTEDDPAYPNYGGRGIKVCDEWKESVESFAEWALQNGYDDSLSIDRINNDGDYCPENCRWANSKTQSNNRRSNIKITIFGETKNMKEWCDIFNIPRTRVSARIKRGWTPEEAILYIDDARIIKRDRKE